MHMLAYWGAKELQGSTTMTIKWLGGSDWELWEPGRDLPSEELRRSFEHI